MPQRHLIIGGGISGLMTAEALIRQFPASSDLQIEIFEGKHWGGMIESRQTPFGLVEKAANGFLSSPALFKLENRLGLQSIGTLPEARKRYIRSDRLRRWPLGFWQSLLLPFYFLKARFSGQLPPRPREILTEWGRRTLGKAFTHEILKAGVQGVYASSADSLSASLVLGRFFRKPSNSKSQRKRLPGQPKGLRSFTSGMQSLPNEIRQRLQHDPRIQWHEREVLASEMQAFVDDENVASIWIATKAPEAAKLLEQSHQELSALLARVPSVPVLSVTVFFKPDPLDPKGFGFLNHPDLGSDTLGVLWNDQIFSERSQMKSETWILKGEGRHRLITRSDDEIRNQILEERARLLPRSQARIEHLEITRWPLGLPHYGLELEEIQEHFQRDWGKLRLVGNYVRGIGLTQIAEWVQMRVETLEDTP